MSTTAVPTITLTGPTSVTSGSTSNYTLSINVLTAGNGGLDVAASAGTFGAGTGTQVMGGEITHTAPNTSTTTHSWTFTWTAPTVTTATSVTLYAAATDSFGGGTGRLQQTITVNPSAPPPTIGASPSTLSFNFQTGGTTPSAQSVAISSSGSALSYSITASAAWLSATPSSGTTGGNISVSVNPSGLAAGTYTGNVTVTAAGASNSPVSVPVTLNVTAPPPTIGASPSSLTFSFQTGGATPTAQTVAVSSSGTAFTYSISTSAAWLSATPSSGPTPGNVSVSVNPSGLAAGTYTGNVSITASGTSNSPKTVPVTLTVTSPPPPSPTITVSPLTLSYSFQIGGAIPAAQMVSVTGSSAVSYTAASSAAWLTVSPSSGTTPGSLSVGINPSGLTAGTYIGTVTVTSASAANSPQKVAVTFTVSGAPTPNPSLGISPATLSFTYTSGSTTAGLQNLSVTSSGSALSITATASGGSWLSVSPASGSTPAKLIISADPTGMATGTYNGSITVTSTGAGNSPQTVPVTLTITSAGSGSGSGTLKVWPPRGVYFEYESGHSQVSSRTVKVYSSKSPLTYMATAQGATWLAVTPSGGTTPGNLTVSADATGLASGRYTGTIAIAATGANTINLPVVLVVATDDGGGDDGTSRSGSTDQIRAWPYAYDPAGTNTVAASWIDGTGAATTSTSSTSDMLNQGLLLSKTSAASNQAQAGVVIRDVEGMSLTELGYDIRQSSQCTAKSPRFVVVTLDEVVHKIGCAAGTVQPAPAAGWKRLRFDPANSGQTVPAIAPGTKVKSIHLVLDDGPETGSSIAVLDNIDINGKVIGKQ